MLKKISGSDARVVLELNLLKRILILTKRTVQVYEHTPLAQSLAKTINSEMEQCRWVLQGLLDNINNHRESLISIFIGFLWRFESLVGWMGSGRTDSDSHH
jgi:tRNA(Phe) wybutosine-synthesizing methylase Tyw3